MDVATGRSSEPDSLVLIDLYNSHGCWAFWAALVSNPGHDTADRFRRLPEFSSCPGPGPVRVHTQHRRTGECRHRHRPHRAQLLRLGQPQEAARLAALAVRLQPNDERLWSVLAKRSSAAISSAAGSLAKAKSLDPQNAGLWFAEASWPCAINARMMRCRCSIRDCVLTWKCRLLRSR